MKILWNFIKTALVIGISSWLFPQYIYAENIKVVLTVSAIIIVVDILIDKFAWLIMLAAAFTGVVDGTLAFISIIFVLICLFFSNLITLNLINTHLNGFFINGWLVVLIMSILISAVQSKKKNKG